MQDLYFDVLNVTEIWKITFRGVQCDRLCKSSAPYLNDIEHHH